MKEESTAVMWQTQCRPTLLLHTFKIYLNFI